MKRTIKLTLLLLFLGGWAAIAQTVESVKPPSDRKKIELRPNSADYGSVHRDNFNNRVERTRDKNKFVKKRPARNLKSTKAGNKNKLRNEQRMQRRQQGIQRRTLNR